MSSSPEADPSIAAAEADRGRHAASPAEVPPKGWLDIAVRTARATGGDHLPLVAAGVAFYAFLAVPPTLAALLGFYALLADAAQIGGQVEALARGLPQEVVPLIREQVEKIVSDNTAAGLGAAFGLAFAIYGSAKAMKAVITGLNLAYDEPERRGFFRLNLTALVLTLGTLLLGALSLGLLVALPVVLARTGLGDVASAWLSWLRWPVLFGAFLTTLAFVYRFGPSREKPQWRWLSWGAGAGTLLWLGGSMLFSYYTSHFGRYDRTYGALGAVVVFLLWLWLAGLAVLLGAKLNAEMERQTAKDTTTRPDQPLGARGAKAADTLGASWRSKHPAPTARQRR